MPNPDCGYLPWEEAGQDLAGPTSDRECYYFLGGPFDDLCTCGDSPHSGQPCPYQGQPEKELIP